MEKADIFHVGGEIEKIQTHKKIYKMRVKTENIGVGYSDIMMFRTDYTLKLKKIVHTILQKIKKEGEQNEEKIALIGTIGRKLPLFLEGNNISAFCSFYKDSICIKQFSLSSPKINDKKRLKIWVKHFDFWLTQLMWKNGKKKNEKKDMNQNQNEKCISMELIAQTRSSLKKALNERQQNEDENCPSVVEYLAKDFHREKDEINIFDILHSIFSRLSIFSQLKKDMQEKCAKLCIIDFNDNEILKIASFCDDDYLSFCSDPYSMYMDKQNHNIGFYLLEKFSSINDVPMIRRLEGNIIHSLQFVMNSDGHTCFPIEKLANLIKTNMKPFLYTTDQKEEFYKLDIENAIRNFSETFVYFSPHTKIEWVYLKFVWERESFIVEKLQRYIEKQKIFTENKNEVIRYIHLFQENINSTFNEKQVQSIISTMCTSVGVNILTGLPGSGKSLVISCIQFICHNLGKHITLCAPTGKAANRLGSKASTLHRLLEGSYDETMGHFRFMRNEKNNLQSGILVIDETSMVDLNMMYYLLKACPIEMSILFVGDRHQLPSINFGDLLHSFIESKVIPYNNLNKVYRQGEGSTISLLSRYIIKGVVPSMDVLNDQKETFFIQIPQNKQENILKMVSHLYKKNRQEKQDSIILSPMRKGILGTSHINHYCHQYCDELLDSLDGYFRRKERVMICNNIYCKDDDGILDVDKSVFNGDIGYFEDIEYDTENIAKCIIDIKQNSVCSHDSSTKTIVVDRENIELAHACTIHKMQGSEMQCVLLIMNNFHANMLNKKLLYTAITRAKKKLYIIGDEDALIQAIQRPPPERYECLSERLSCSIETKK